MAHRCFQDMRFFVLSYSLLLFVDIIAGLYYRSALTTIERRFELSTTNVAVLTSAYQVGSLAVTAFVSFYGSRTHRPRFIACGAGVTAVGYLISCLPQFFGGRYEYVDTLANSSALSSKQAQMCATTTTMTSNTTTCETTENGNSNNLYILIAVGLLLSGVGAAPLQPLGMSYIDDYSPPRKSPVYIGISMTIALIGPAIGFLLGAALLRIWVDVGWIDISQVKILPTNPSWVGAWWIGFLLTGILIAAASIPLCWFPKKMKSKESKENVLELNLDSGEENDDDGMFKVSMKEEKGFFNVSKNLLTNTTFLMILMMWIFSAYNGIAEITFFPKYLEVQFGVSASKANMYYGAIAIPCLAVGTLLGAYLMKRLNLDRLGMVSLLLGSHMIYVLLAVAFIFLGCETIDIAGLTKPYTESTDSEVLSTLSSCNSGCDCENGTFAPVCGADGLTYLSPCHAGCKGVYSEIEGIAQNYTDCSCIVSQTSNADNHSNWSYPERCQKSKCGHLVALVLAMRSLSNLLGGISATPAYVFLMRSVGRREKAFAIGIAFIIVRLLSWIPAPLIYGKIIDSTCILWATTPCGSGYCRVYDADTFRVVLFSVMFCAEALSCMCTGVLYLMTRRQKRSGSDKYKCAGRKGKEKHIVLRRQKSSTKAEFPGIIECSSGSPEAEEISPSTKMLL